MSGNVDQQNVDQRFAPPEAPVQDLAPAGTTDLAPRWARLGAAIVDGLILMGLVWALSKVPIVVALAQIGDANDVSSWWAWRPRSLIFSFGLFLLVQGWPLVKRGQTLGKMACRLRIVRSDGSRPDAWRLLGLRYGVGFLMNMNLALSMTYGLLDPLLIFRKSRKCLHDSIADTKVIKL